MKDFTVRSAADKASSKTQEVNEISNEVTDSDSNGRYIKYDQEMRSTRRDLATWTDIFTIVCAGVALISDGYQNSVMNMLNKVFAVEFPKEYDANMSAAVSNASLVGTIFGQFAIGICSDYLGRKWSIVTATLFVIVGTIMCAASHGVTVNGMFWMLIISRGITGFGVGAEYPSSSISSNESANEVTKKRGGVMILVTNLPLSLGNPFALCIFLVVYKITGSSHLSALWRTLYAIGAFWPLAVFYFRWRMATGALYKKSAITKRVPYLLMIKYYWPRMIGTCGCWFLYDFVTFPNGIFSSGIIASVLGNTTDLTKIAEWNLLLASLSIPGVLVGAYLADVIGRKYTLMVGFSGYIVFGLIVGCAYEKISNIVPLFIVFYGLMQSMGNLGPGCIMGLSSSESYATPVRGTMYGISAAIGKVGAVVGTKCFTPIQVHLGKKWTFIIAAVCGLVGIACAYFFVPHLMDDDLMREDINFSNYLISNGWDGHFGTDEDEKTSDAEDSVESIEVLEKQ